ncbi:hypothetical protein [Marinobacterium lacunae]|nr:hypothetical protein [Marinobacterium lacunae]
MDSEIIYHFKKNRKQLSLTYIRMGIACWVYMAGLYGYEYFFETTVSQKFQLYWNIVFFIASVVLFYVAWWHRTHPATFEAKITKDRFMVSYPEVPEWSFDVKIADIKRFEKRNTLSHAGKGIIKHGILLKDGTFHHISMNYGNSINKMHKVIQSIAPEITFPKKVNMKVFGPIAKDYVE